MLAETFRRSLIGRSLIPASKAAVSNTQTTNTRFTPIASSAVRCTAAANKLAGRPSCLPMIDYLCCANEQLTGKIRLERVLEQNDIWNAITMNRGRPTPNTRRPGSTTTFCLDPAVESVDSIWERCKQVVNIMYAESDWVVDCDAVWPTTVGGG